MMPAEVTTRRRKRKVLSVARVNTYYGVSIPTQHCITESMLLSKSFYHVFSAEVTIKR